MTTRFPVERIRSGEMTVDGCRACFASLDFDFTFAFQPIIRWSNNEVFGFEALVRSPDGGGAAAVLSRVTAANRYAFDQACRVRALHLASALGLRGMLSINFLPNAVYEPEHCIRSTLEAAAETGFPVDRVMFEVTESEELVDPAHLTSVFASYEAHGFTTALDDFGAGFAGLTRLASFQPHIVKVDMELVRGIDADPVRRAILRNLLRLCDDLGITALAEGVETAAEAATLIEMGVDLLQGYWIAKPGFESLPDVAFDLLASQRHHAVGGDRS